MFPEGGGFVNITVPEGGGFVNITVPKGGPTATGMNPEGGTAKKVAVHPPPPPPPHRLINGTALSITGNLITMLRVKRDFVSRDISSTSFIPSVSRHTVCRPFKCLKFQKLLLRFYDVRSAMMAVDNVVFVSKRSIIIKLPVNIPLKLLNINSQLCFILLHEFPYAPNQKSVFFVWTNLTDKPYKDEIPLQLNS